MVAGSLRSVTLTALLVAGLGCGGKSDPAPARTEPVVEAGGKAVAATPVSRGGAAPAERDRLHKAFADAVRGADDPPEDAVRPPDETVSKKPVYKFCEQVKERWDAIRFVTADGKKLDYVAKVETSVGAFEIALLHEQAPNHVRNFIALAQAGYYDQLFVEGVRHEANKETKTELHMLEAGCPLGTGTTGTGSIGYWLKDELTPGETMSHDEGTVGACHGVEADSAATRFYITLNKASFLDGHHTIFGKVVTGVEVLRKMGQTPVVIDDEGSMRPQTPLVIQKVTVVATPREASK